MLRRISVLLLSALLMVAVSANVALAAAGEGKLSNKGQPGSDEPKTQGSPDDPNAWGSVVTQTAIPSEEEGVDAGTFGKHASNPPGGQPRDGLGNAARTDAGYELNAPDTGDHVGDHACIADDPFGANCTAEPGNSPDRPDS